MMQGLRWTLGILTLIATGGWVTLAIIGGGFRRSFGASDNGQWMIVVPVLVAALVIASLLAPERRALLHGVAVIMVLLMIGCLVIARETAFVATLGIVYALGWLTYYYRVLRP